MCWRLLQTAANNMTVEGRRNLRDWVWNPTWPSENRAQGRMMGPGANTNTEADVLHAGQGLDHSKDTASSIKDTSWTLTQPLIPLCSGLWSLETLALDVRWTEFCWRGQTEKDLAHWTQEDILWFNLLLSLWFFFIIVFFYHHVKENASYSHFFLSFPDSSSLTLLNASVLHSSTPTPMFIILCTPLCLLCPATDSVTYSLWPGCCPAGLRMNYDVLDQS